MRFNLERHTHQHGKEKIIIKTEMDSVSGGGGRPRKWAPMERDAAPEQSTN